MGEHTPIFKDANAVTRITSADVTGGQVLIVSGANTVGPSASAVPGWVGIAAHDATSGNPVLVLRGGEHTLVASGAIAAGASVIPAAAGAVATIGAETNYFAVVGTAIAAAASGTVRVLLAR